MSVAERAAAVILAAWRRQGWPVRPELADEAIKDLTSHGGRFCDLDQRIADVRRLVEWRANLEIPDTADKDVADRFIGDDAPDAFGAGLYRKLARLPYHNAELIAAMFSVGLHRALPFLRPDVRAEVGRELLGIHAPGPQMVAAAE